MSERKLNTQYTGTDIKKYLEGKLSSAEMHAIEKAALTDPFLADAIEGMSAVIKTGELNKFNKEVDELNREIQPKKNNISILLKVAAAIIVVITTIALIFNQSKPVNKTALVAAAEALPKDEEIMVPLPLDTIIAFVPESSISKKKAGKKADNNSIVTPHAPAPLAITVEEEKAESPEHKEIADQVKNDSREKTEVLKALSGRSSGVVISPQKKRDNTSNSLDEVVTTTYYNSKKVKPAGGWEKFNKYVKENKRSDTLNPTITGEVIVSFTINEEGTTSFFSIDKSLSSFYNEEAIRLIKEGPKWKFRGPSNKRTKISIKF